MVETYQGYKNRSTWLACLWLDNTSLEVHEHAKSIARRVGKVGERIKEAEKLLNETGINTELSYNKKEISWKEVFDHLNNF